MAKRAGVHFRKELAATEPCPVTIFTFGLLLLSGSAVRWWLLVNPFIWTLVGGSAALLLRVPQDWFLLFSEIVAVPIILR